MEGTGESYREWRTLAQKTLSAQSARYFSLLMNPAGGAPLEKHFYFCRSVYRQTDGRTDRQAGSSQWPFLADSVTDSLGGESGLKVEWRVDFDEFDDAPFEDDDFDRIGSVVERIGLLFRVVTMRRHVGLKVRRAPLESFERWIFVKNAKFRK